MLLLEFRRPYSTQAKTITYNMGPLPIFMLLLVTLVAGRSLSEDEPYSPAIPVAMSSSRAYIDATTKSSSLFYAIAYEATIMSLEPRNFLRWRANDYLSRTVDYINEVGPAPVSPTFHYPPPSDSLAHSRSLALTHQTMGEYAEAWLSSVHGEDGGTGAITTVIFFTGGREAAEKFRTETLEDWDIVQNMYPAYPFGKGCHMEGYSWPCIVDEYGLRPSPQQIREYKLKPTLQLWVAVPSTHPEDVTKEMQDKINMYVAEALKPAESVVTSDWFVDDNFEAVKYGAKIKPVCPIDFG